jgi:hypothetical protein
LYLWIAWARLAGASVSSANFIREPFAILHPWPTALLGALLIGLTIWYIRDAARNVTFTTTLKIMWGLIIFKFGVVAMLIYWYLYLWRNAAPGEWAATAGRIAESG